MLLILQFFLLRPTTLSTISFCLDLLATEQHLLRIAFGNPYTINCDCETVYFMSTGDVIHPTDGEPSAQIIQVEANQQKQGDGNSGSNASTSQGTGPVAGPATVLDDILVGPFVSAGEFQESFRRHVKYSLGKEWGTRLSSTSILQAVSLAVRNVMVDRMLATEQRYRAANAKRLYYLSMEFLVGRSLGNNLCNLNLFDLCARILREELGVELEDIREEEHDAALGNGGLGRLAACFLDSLATMDMPGYGYGINYEYGMFKQELENGYQKEKPDAWRANFSPWLIERPDEYCVIPIYGHLVDSFDRHGNPRPAWMDTKHLIGLPSDMPIVGYGGRTVNYLRLYSARASSEFDIQKFNEGEYVKAVEERIASETISKVLYPSDAVEAGRELRLIQEYFFVACAIRDIVRRYLKKHPTFDEFTSLVAIQLNDTHPALTVAELMRILLDEQNMKWEKAWAITQETLGYTNHTLLPEALEKWPVGLIQRVLPRHLSIIYEINNRFLRDVGRRWPDDPARLGQMSIIEDTHGFQQVRMAHLAIVGSHAVNGVAKLHSDLVTKTLVPDFYQLWPEKFSNKTNGVTQRRWLLKANPGLTELIHRSIGNAWITDLSKLKGLEKFADDPQFQAEFMAIKKENKIRLAKEIKERTGIEVNPSSTFDVIAKRIHEYKRQLLMAMRVLYDYLALIEDRKEPTVPRTYIFAGKAAPGYWAAKQIIKLINDLAAVINNDSRVRDRIKVVFIPDYRVSLAEKIIPAADISEQISTAGKEASGTSNMKFAMNGALTVCTYDGANIEIMEEVGEENMYVFGLKAEEVQQMRDVHSYNPWDYYRRSPQIKRMMDAFTNDHVFTREPGLYSWIFNAILNLGDPYFHLADFESYVETQERAANEYKTQHIWARKAILNVARIGKFSSDRTIREYAEDIWNIRSIP